MGDSVTIGSSLTSEGIRSALARNVKAVTRMASIGCGTATTRVKVVDGMRCEIKDGPWELVADMTPKYGGTGAGPNPGTLGRAALGSCVAMGYVMWASRMGVPIRGLSVDVEADYDVRGELGVGDVSPAYGEIRLVVTVETDAPERDVCEVLRVADEHSSYLQMFRQPVRVVRETWFAPPPQGDRSARGARACEEDR